MIELQTLLQQIRSCTICQSDLVDGTRPVVQCSENSRILIVGQAPGRTVHNTGIPFNDPSGDRLRSWMGVNRDQFYDPELCAIVPMGFCFPGSGKSGDLPPRRECAPAWRDSLLDQLVNIKLTLVIGQYAQAWHLEEKNGRTLTATVMRWQEFLPSQIVLPHPSPRNIRWFRNNPWFEQEVVPYLHQQVSRLIKGSRY